MSQHWIATTEMRRCSKKVRVLVCILGLVLSSKIGAEKLPCFDEAEQVVQNTDGGSGFESLRKYCKEIVGDTPASVESTAVLTRKISNNSASIDVRAVVWTLVPLDEYNLQCKAKRVEGRHAIYRNGAQVFSLRSQSELETLVLNYETKAALPFGGTKLPNYPPDRRKPHLQSAPWLTLSAATSAAMNRRLSEGSFGFDFAGVSNVNGLNCKQYRTGAQLGLCVFDFVDGCKLGQELWAARSGIREEFDYSVLPGFPKSVTVSLRTGKSGEIFGSTGILRPSVDNK
jgi:hypothetical protein